MMVVHSQSGCPYRHWNALPPLSAQTLECKKCLKTRSLTAWVSFPQWLWSAENLFQSCLRIGAYTLSPQCLVSSLDCSWLCIAIAIPLGKECDFSWQQKAGFPVTPEIKENPKNAWVLLFPDRESSGNLRNSKNQGKLREFENVNTKSDSEG